MALPNEMRGPFNAVSVIDQMLRPLDQPVPILANLFNHNYRFFLRRVGGHFDEITALLHLGNPRIGEIMHERRVHILHVKAHLLKLILLGKLSFASAGDGTQESNKYSMLLESLIRVVMVAIVMVFETISWLGSMCSLNWYYELPQECQALLDVVLTLCLLCGLWRWYKMERTLVPFKVGKGDNRYLGQVFGPDGVEHLVLVDGKERKFRTTQSDDSHKDEMAMPGSDYFPCKSQNIGAILVATDQSDLRLFGTYWRLEDVFVTARHCSETLYQSTASIYLTRIRMTKKGNYEIDRSKVVKVPAEFFSPDDNLISSYTIDAFMKELEPPMWSKLAIPTSSTKIRSAYGLNVHSVGFTPDGLLVSATGRTLPNSGFELLYHTASTQQGFSGSIIICGNSVVGMHVRAGGEYNVAIRVEYLEYLLASACEEEAASKNKKKYTYADAAYKQHFREHKWRGGVADAMLMRDGRYAIILQDGQATYGWHRDEIIECFGRHGNYQKDEDELQDLVAFGEQPGDQTLGRRQMRKGKNQQLLDVQFEDDKYHYKMSGVHAKDWENAPIEPEIRASRKKTKRRKGPTVDSLNVNDPNVGYEWLYEERNDGKPIHGPTPAKMQPEITQVFENRKSELVELGYEEGTFLYPTLSPDEEVVSLRKHLQLFGDRVKKVVKPPSDEEIKRCASLVAAKLAPAAYIPDEDYDQVSGALDVINSSVVGVKKSSGYPFVLEGLPTNGQVLEHYGVKGFAQYCVNHWLQPIVAKWFGKGEPTKRKKIDKGMPRGVQGLGTNVLVNHACIFRNFFDSLIRQMKHIPVKFAWNPATPGHLEHMKEVLPGSVYESDKPNWDCMFQKWIVEVLKPSIGKLALRHPNWTEEQFDKYLRDVDMAIDQIFYHTNIRTSNGTLFVMKEPGIMISGCFGTITFNSIAQLIIDTMVKMRLGYTDEDILDTMAIIAGGDDVEQDLEGVDLPKYIAESAILGIETEIHKRDDLEHSEYFSNDIRRDDHGRFMFFPKRFTKHIEHLRTVKLEDLSNALCSHMGNYRHHKERFLFLENVYHELREKHPAHFPLGVLKSRKTLLDTQYGYEHVEF